MQNDNYSIKKISLDQFCLFLNKPVNIAYLKQIAAEFEVKFSFNQRDLLVTVFVYTVLDSQKVFTAQNYERKGYDVYLNEIKRSDLNAYLGITYFTVKKDLSKAKCIKKFKSE